MPSQTSSEFWNEVGTTSADIEHLYGFLLERGIPLSSRELAANLVEWRVHEEERHLAELAARRAPIYQPKNTYSSGQSVIFTAFGNREGTVDQVRAGDNPRLGEFQVIKVRLEGETEPREFATAYAAPHPLNQEITQSAISLGVTPEEAIAQFGEQVHTSLVQRLGADKEFVHIGDQWFLKGLLPEIHPGYLNLAEAAIEQAGDAESTGQLAQVLDLPSSGKKAAVDFALNHALASDSRFEDVGPASESRWILTRMELPEARERPAVLDVLPARTIRLPQELETIATDLYDTAESNGSINKPIPAPKDEITLVLTYPHRRAGTIPILPPIRALLPAFGHPRLKFNFVDAASHDKFPGYAVADGNYLAGLASWFNARRLSPGAYIILRRSPEPLTIEVDYQPQRERSLWVRVARGMNGRLIFAQEKRPLSHKYDEEMLIVIADPVSLDAVAQTAREQRPLPVLLEDIFPELAKLSGAGRVHAKTLYSAVSLIRRISPRAVMTALTESHNFSSVGGGYFVMNEEARR